MGKGTGNSYQLSIRSTGKLGLYNNNGTAESVSSNVLATNMWHHVVGTYATSANSSKLYVDGVDVTTYPGAGTTFTGNTSAVSLGSEATSSYFDGFWKGTETLISILHNQWTAHNDQWIFSCSAFDGLSNSSWMNSSTITITDSVVPSISFVTPPTDLNNSLSPY